MLGGFIHQEEERKQQWFFTSHVHLSICGAFEKRMSWQLSSADSSLVHMGNFDASLVKIHCNIMSRQVLVDPRIWIRNTVF